MVVDSTAQHVTNTMTKTFSYGAIGVTSISTKTMPSTLMANTTTQGTSASAQRTTDCTSALIVGNGSEKTIAIRATPT